MMYYLIDGISLVRSPEFIKKKSHPALNKKLDSKTYMYYATLISSNLYVSICVQSTIINRQRHIPSV